MTRQFDGGAVSLSTMRVSSGLSSPSATGAAAPVVLTCRTYSTEGAVMA